MRKIILIVVAVLIVFAIYEMGRHRSGPARSAVGPVTAHSVAPDFSLQNLDGQPLNLAAFKGKVVLLDFWATWCVPCRSEIPHFVEFQQKYAPQGLQVVGISMDDGPKPVRQFYTEMKMNYPVAVGTEAMAQSYGGVLGLPITFLIDRDGRIYKKHIGEVDMSVFEQEIQTLLQAK
jgi:thiol-disulfide isomerase/thioredoxin